MAVQIPGTIPRILEDGQTGSQRASGFARVRLEGAKDLVQELINLATRFGEDASNPLTAAAKKAAKPIMEEYKANISDITGNLRRSVVVKAGRKKYPATGIAVAGPQHVVNAEEWDVEKKGAGNHAFLVEFGTGPRKPGSMKRRTYVNVHQRINGKMRRVSQGSQAWFNNEEFENLGRGYYFLMGSKNEEHPERKTGRGAFVKTDGGGTRPYTLGAKETYPAMPPSNIMEDAILTSRTESFGVLEKELRQLINKRLKRR
jgi:hypothetical protein